MEAESLAERILQDLNTVFKKDPYINEFDVVPEPVSTTNKCPVIHVDHKVALESWCVPHVYLHAYSQLMKYRNKQIKADTSTLLIWLRTLLLINPDLLTAWNMRKELITTHHLTVEEDLLFSELVLIRKPKSGDVFAHRAWLLLHEAAGSKLSQARVEKEMWVCEQAAQRYPSNYYAWNHRIWLLDNLEPAALFVVLVSELSRTEDWLFKHVSDHSGFHYRQVLLKKIDDLISEDGIFIQKELAFTSEVIGTFPGHEAPWSHRRFILSMLVCSFAHHSSLPVPSNQSSANNANKKSRLDFHWLLEQEEKFVANLPSNQGSSSSHLWQKELASRHLKWLTRVFPWTSNNSSKN